MVWQFLTFLAFILFCVAKHAYNVPKFTWSRLFDIFSHIAYIFLILHLFTPLTISKRTYYFIATFTTLCMQTFNQRKRHEKTDLQDRYSLFIDGEWKEASDGGTFESFARPMSNAGQPAPEPPGKMWTWPSRRPPRRSAIYKTKEAAVRTGPLMTDY